MWARFPPDKEGLPFYLREGIFEKIRTNAGRIKWVAGDICSVLARSPEGAYTKVTLSNAFEWIPQAQLPGVFEVLGRAVAPHGRVVLRHQLGIAQLLPYVLLTELTELSERLTHREKDFLYAGISIYERAWFD